MKKKVILVGGTYMDYLYWLRDQVYGKYKRIFANAKTGIKWETFHYTCMAVNIIGRN